MGWYVRTLVDVPATWKNSSKSLVGFLLLNDSMMYVGDSVDIVSLFVDLLVRDGAVCCWEPPLPLLGLDNEPEEGGPLPPLGLPLPPLGFL